MQSLALAREQRVVRRLAHQRVAERVCGLVGPHEDVARERFTQSALEITLGHVRNPSQVVMGHRAGRGRQDAEHPLRLL